MIMSRLTHFKQMFHFILMSYRLNSLAISIHQSAIFKFFTKHLQNVKNYWNKEDCPAMGKLLRMQN